MKRFCDLKKGDKIYKIDLLIPKIKKLEISSDWFRIVEVYLGFERCNSIEGETIRIPNEAFYYSSCLDYNYNNVYYADPSLTKTVLEGLLEMKGLDERFIKTLDVIYLDETLYPPI